MRDVFFEQGWTVFAPEPAVKYWCHHAREDALRALRDPALDHWYQCDRTWFVGLDALDNDTTGRVAGSQPLSGAAVDFVSQHLGGWPALHRAQLSGVFPGYPRRREGETDAGFAYRRNRDAAHVDGVLGVGQPKRRFVEEPHAFILGLPLTAADANAAPLVVWEGSHQVMQTAFRQAFSDSDATGLEAVDVTEVYTDARRSVFATCPRRVVHAPPGAVILVHRLCLHGVAPWAPDARAASEGRLIAYVRPAMPGGVRAWVEAA